jgi:hypothetical protein
LLDSNEKAGLSSGVFVYENKALKPWLADAALQTFAIRYTRKLHFCTANAIEHTLFGFKQ